MERREFLRKSLLLGAATPLRGPLSPPLVLFSPQNVSEALNYDEETELTPIQRYLVSIEEEKEAIFQILKNYPGYPEVGFALKGIKRLSRERELAEFNMYFPFYRAAEIKYNVPWSLLMIIHAHETTFSSDPNTYNNLHRGAMQRSYRSWPDHQIYEASEGFEFLAELPQRYPNDFREIMWAAKHIRDQANIRYFYLSEEEANLAVVRYNYSAESNAILRVQKYWELKPSLQIPT